MMKSLRQLLLLAAITVGFSLTATAQRQDEKKPPPKDPNPPKIRVEDKKNDKPKDDKRDDRRDDRRRPGMAYISKSDKSEVV